MKKLMHLLAKLFPNSAKGENAVAVKMFYRLTSAKEFFRKIKSSSENQWPVLSGNYWVVNPTGKIAVCTLTSENLLPKEDASENIAIIGTVYTPNLGIERIILNIISNPNIRHLVVCGRDSPIFRASQALQNLFEYGIDAENRILNAKGHFPVLKNLSTENIDHFVNQVELVNLSEETDLHIIRKKIEEININSETYKTPKVKKPLLQNENFIKLKPGGKRTPLEYDKNGFFVITTDHDEMNIIVKHYYKDNRPGFIIKGHSPESILLAILKKGLVSQMSHAGYLGAELAKANIALKLNLSYKQDQSLKQ